MASRYEIRLSGSGGQGLILLGIILGETASIYENKNAVQSQSYGPEARGGMSKSDVIISDDEIDYPKAYNVDFLLALTQQSFDRYTKEVKKGGIVLYDSTLVHSPKEGDYRLIGLPLHETAVRDIGKSMVINIVSLGAIVKISNIVTIENTEKALLKRVPKGTEELNKKAFYAGVSLAK
ncbi:MAG: 2-oxoacid:acceptor oxidoreductase family protein [Deltaproteobacteria bacterium]|nr:2-oxoacid:acceptor oxidoreductase family protein [Deltaproteobacteria bacterium]